MDLDPEAVDLDPEAPEAVDLDPEAPDADEPGAPEAVDFEPDAPEADEPGTPEADDLDLLPVDDAELGFLLETVLFDDLVLELAVDLNPPDEGDEDFTPEVADDLTDDPDFIPEMFDEIPLPP